MPTRGRPPLLSDETILDAALMAFAASGYAGMSVRGLNAELGLSHETISKRFGPKRDLFRAAVARGVALLICDFDEEVARCAPVGDLERLRATVRGFMVASSRHPAVGDLLHHASIDADHRAVMLSASGFAERIADTVALLGRLQQTGVIRETRIREMWFLAESAVAPLRFPGLAQMFDPFDGPLNPDELIDRMVEALMCSLLVPGSSEP